MTNRISLVWIDEGCIPNCSCEDICPVVFKYPSEDDYNDINSVSSKIRGESRVDGLTSVNKYEKSELIKNIGIKFFNEIQKAADGCPVEVIKFEIIDD